MSAKSSHGGRRAGAGRKPKSEAQAASFEDAQPTYNRPTIWMASMEAKREATAWDRIKLMRSARWAVNNSGIASRIIRGTARFAVGNGLVPQAQTSDSNWNSLVERLFEMRYCNTPFAFDRAAMFDFYSVQTALAESVMTDGDVFAQLVRSESGFPMARFFGGEYVQSEITDGEGWVDGVRVNDERKPLAYKVLRDPSSNATGTSVDAEDIIHIRRAHRLGYIRGISWLGAAISRIQDMREAMDNELLAAKLNTKVALVIESEDAGSSGLGAGLRRQSYGANSEDALKMDKLIPGVGSVQLKPGEKLAAHEFDRPNTNLQTFIDHLCRECAYSVGVSPEIIWSMAGLGGTASRSALIDAEVFFASIRSMIENQFCVRFWRYAVWDMIQKGEVPYPGDDWFQVSFIPPQRLTVDSGRDGKLRMDLVHNGLLSRRQYFNELGQDVDKHTDDIIRDAARRKKRVAEIAGEEGVELSVMEVFPPPPGSTQPMPAQDEPEDSAVEGEDDETDDE